MFVFSVYKKGYSALDVIKLLEDETAFQLDYNKRYELLVAFNKVRKEFMNNIGRISIPIFFYIKNVLFQHVGNHQQKCFLQQLPKIRSYIQ